MIDVILNNDTLILAAKILYEHQSEFDAYLSGTGYITSIGMMKEYSNLTLKESKNIIDLYRVGKLIPGPDIKKQRLEKLEKLEKNNVVNEITEKIKILNTENIKNIFNSLTINQLIILNDEIKKINSK